jgi:spoIIIJ-associated protein
MTSIEKTAETVEAAIQAGLRELGVSASDVMVEVLEEPSRGIMGVGVRPARVRLVLMNSRRETTTYSPMGMPEYNEPPAPETPFRPEDYERFDPTQSRSTPRGPRGPRSDGRPGAPRGDRPQGQGGRSDSRPPGPRGERPYQGPSERAQGQNDRRPYQGPSERAANQAQTGVPPRTEGERPAGWTDRRPERGPRREGGAPRSERSDRGPRRDRSGESSHQYDYEPNDDDIAAPVGLEVTEAEADETARVGKELLVQLLERMHLDATVTIHRAEPTRETEELHWILNIGGVEMSRLIGRRGETLTAIQYLLRLMISRRLQTHANIIVDAGGYKANRANRLKQLAVRMADQAIAQNRTIVLEPMPPHERRIVHLALRARPDVSTKSIGEGDNRKVTISRKANADE